jgi:hypothetical protein
MHAGYAFVSVQTDHLPGLSCLSFSEPIYTPGFKRNSASLLVALVVSDLETVVGYFLTSFQL